MFFLRHSATSQQNDAYSKLTAKGRAYFISLASDITPVFRAREYLQGHDS